MPKNKKPTGVWITNPETKEPAFFPMNRAARRAFKKEHNTDIVPPPYMYPIRKPNGQTETS